MSSLTKTLPPLEAGGREPRYAVLGDPIAHSLSPLLFNLFAEQTHQSIAYQAIPTPLDKLESTLRELCQQGYHGVNLTAPLKEKAYMLANELTPEAQKAKSVNMMTFTTNGGWLGHNTDGLGFIRDLTQIKKYPITNKSILILGAGGAVRGLLPAILDQSPRSVLIANRTESKARILAEEFQTLDFSAWSEIPSHRYDLLIHATTAREDLALPSLNATVWYDLIYGPGRAYLLNLAKKQNVAHCYSGIGMLIEQAAEAFYLWRNIRIDTLTLHERLLTI